MDYTLSEWLNLLVRWTHVFAGILWIGQTYFFTWLDGRFAADDASGPRASTPTPVWLVHSGGFYVVEKRPLQKEVPPGLKWFRWEAAITWISGFVLLSLVYHAGGLMVDANNPVTSAGQAIGIGVGVMIVGWAVYDGLLQSPLGKSERLVSPVFFLLLALASYGLCQVMSGRAAYIHVGALLGTIMTANVWMRILPAQRRMIKAVADGRAPDWSLADRAKQRTMHNTFLAIPVVFIMVSNHFPVATYGNRYNWLILLVLVLVGCAAANHLRRV